MTDTEDLLGIQSRKYMLFHLGDLAYGFGVLRVREVIDPPQLQPVDSELDDLAGIVTVRNKAIPVLDLRRRHRLPAPERKEGANRCVVVVQVRLPEEKAQLGLLFDRPAGIVAIRGDDIDAGAAPLPDAPDDGIVGTVRRPDGLIVRLLNPDRLGGDPAVAEVLKDYRQG